MLYRTACQKAKKLAHKRNEWLYIFFERPDDGIYGYDYGDEYDADTFFCGLNPVAAVSPDGCIER